MNKVTRMAIYGMFGMSVLFEQASYADGIIGGLINKVAPGVGTTLDNTNRELKQRMPGYRWVDESGSAFVRKGAREVSGEVGGNVLAQWIWASKSNALRAGTNNIPSSIRQQLRSNFPDYILDRVQFRVGTGNELALPANAFRSDAVAITLDYVIVFENSWRAFNDVELWAHELTHVMQYQSWGVLNFAKRYSKDWRSVEREAENNARRIMATTRQPRRLARTNEFTRINIGANSSAMGNYCTTFAGTFGPGPWQRVGAPCLANTPKGRIQGNIVRFN